MTNHNRRKFILTSLKAGAMLSLAGTTLSSCDNKKEEAQSDSQPTIPAAKPKKLNILILGGTSFLGPHQIAAAMRRGHSISTFTRGKTLPTIHQELFKDVEQLIGDRVNNLEALRNRKWDAVIDNSGRKVKWTEDTAELLKENVGLYLYTSSTGVYYPYLGNNIKEDTDLVLDMPKGIEDEEEQMEYGYGIMKANSELAAQRIFGKDRTIVVRPTYMVGPGDKLDRFIHWPVRLSQGGEIMVPGKSDDPVQFMDVRDVANWMIHLIEQQKAGTYNAVGPASAMGMHDFVKQAATAFDTKSTFVMIDDYDFLEQQKVFYIVPWIMPTGNNAGSALVSNQLAMANGLKFTPLVQTMKDTHQWWYSEALTEERRQQFEGKAESVLGREKAIIAAWKERKG